MDYYDGNTVTGLWNHAQHFALNDNSFDTVRAFDAGCAQPDLGRQRRVRPSTGPLPGTLENGTLISDADSDVRRLLEWHDGFA